MAERQTGASAYVTMTVKIKCKGSWGNECQLDQVYKQAAEEAMGALRILVEDARKRGNPIELTLIGEPKVTSVLAEREP